MPTVVFIGGAEIGLGFLQTLVALRDAGECDLIGAIPAHKFENHTPLIVPYAERMNVPVLSKFNGADVIISAGNHQMIEPDVLSRSRVINFHAAPLPDYRGSAAPAHAIMNDETEFGVTFHLMTEELDVGPIYHVERFPIDPNWTAGELDAHCVEVGTTAFARIASSILRDDIRAAEPHIQAVSGGGDI